MGGFFKRRRTPLSNEININRQQGLINDKANEDKIMKELVKRKGSGKE